MKTYKLLCMMFFLLNGSVAYSQGYRYLYQCSKITNLNDYPAITMLNMEINYAQDGSIFTVVITSESCMHQAKFLEVLVYAVNNSYLTGKDISTIDWRYDSNAVETDQPIAPSWGSVPSTSLISTLVEHYKILGFTSNSVVMHKWKSVYTFIDHRPDSIIYHPYTGDVSKLSQTLEIKNTGIQDSHYNASIVLFPNPAHKSFSLKFNDTPRRSISVKILTPEGKTVRTFEEQIPENQTDFTFPVESLAKGLYFVRIHDGAAESVKKLVIE